MSTTNRPTVTKADRATASRVIRRHVKNTGRLTPGRNPFWYALALVWDDWNDDACLAAALRGAK